MDIKNVIITGIGGQGVLYASSILRLALADEYGAISGCDNRGGAQRLGHVASVVRFDAAGNFRGGGRAPAIDFADGGCDLAIALEASELLKFNGKLGPRSVIVSDEFLMPPTNVRRSDSDYFKFVDIKSHFENIAPRYIHGDLRGRAAALYGTPLAANLLALGLLIKNSGGLLPLRAFERTCRESDYAIIAAAAENGAGIC